jgi:hypothetical protein
MKDFFLWFLRNLDEYVNFCVFDKYNILKFVVWLVYGV